MSGVCGIWVQSPDTKRLSCIVQAGLEAMAHRGRDGYSIYPERNVAIGHCLFDTGCNGMFIDEAGYAISFDGRLDNRDALVAMLKREDVEMTDLDRMRDEALLLKAYRHFGSALTDHLRGDFALAIWNPEAETLFLCRDHFGVRPLFYVRAEGAVYFASEVKALLAMVEDASFTVRDKAIAGFVIGDLDNTEPGRTFFEEVYRLLPGHCAEASARGMKIRRYWSLDPSHAVWYANAGLEFKQLLTRSINRRLRTTAPVGALLSGGLDSSAIVSVIGARMTHVVPAMARYYSMTFPDNLIEDETPYIDAVLNAYQLAGTKIQASGTTAFQGLDTILQEQDHPPPAPNTCTFRHFLQAVASEGDTRVVLHGHGGDEVVSDGAALFLELAESGRWIRLWHELGRSEAVLGPRKNHFARLIRQRTRDAFRRSTVRWLRPRRLLARDTVRFAPDGRPRSRSQIQHLRDLTSPLFAHALEVTDHEAAAAGLELRMPFLDVDLVSFCVTVLAEEKWAAGYPRALLRRALAGILPDVVARRRDKFDFAHHLRQSVLRDHASQVEDALFANAGWIAPYADVSDLRAKWNALQDSEVADGASLMELWRAVVLSRWLQSVSRNRGAANKPLLEAAE